MIARLFAVLVVGVVTGASAEATAPKYPRDVEKFIERVGFCTTTEFGDSIPIAAYPAEAAVR